jgi:hypothetical protein
MKQLTVLVPNEIGVAARLTTCLADHGVNIEEIDLEGMENRGIVVLTVDRYDDAMRALSDQGFRVITQNTLLIRLQDRPGALATVAVRLKNANLDVRSMHILSRHEGGVIVSLVASDNAKAAEVLKDVLVTEHQ